MIPVPDPHASTLGLTAWLSGPASDTLNSIGRRSILRVFGTRAIRNRRHFQIEGGALCGGVVLVLVLSLSCVLIARDFNVWKLIPLGVCIGGGLGAILGCMMIVIDDEFRQ
jgi:hypothetical protein